MTPLSSPEVQSQPAAFTTCNVTGLDSSSSNYADKPEKGTTTAGLYLVDIVLFFLAVTNAYAESTMLLLITIIKEEAMATAKTAAIDLLLNVTFDDYDYVIFFKKYGENKSC
jgi:hypothetical protein